MNKEDVKRILQSFLSKKKNSLYYFGEYSNWQDAEFAAFKYGGAYEDTKILNQVAEATQMVRQGKALYEQDGVCFYKKNNNWEIISAFLYVFSQKTKLEVVDWGGH